MEVGEVSHFTIESFHYIRGRHCAHVQSESFRYTPTYKVSNSAIYPRTKRVIPLYTSGVGGTHCVHVQSESCHKPNESGLQEMSFDAHKMSRRYMVEVPGVGKVSDDLHKPQNKEWLSELDRRWAGMCVVCVCGWVNVWVWVWVWVCEGRGRVSDDLHKPQIKALLAEFD